MKLTSFDFCVWFIFQEADGNASGFYKYLRADKIQTRSNPDKYHFQPEPNPTNSQIRV